MDNSRGDRVMIQGIDSPGVIKTFHADGTVTVNLDNGMTLRAPVKCITSVINKNKNEECNTESPDRDERGRFLPGNKPKPHKRTTVKEIRNNIREKLSPFIEKIDVIIEQIDEPADQVLAISRMMKFCVPTLNAVDLKDSNSRNLNAEQKLAKLNAEYHKTKDPTEDIDDEEDDE